jgi:hypothetical protein
MRAITRAALVTIGSAVAFRCAAPAGQSQKQALEQQLQSKYPPTRLAGDKLRIVQPGTVLVLRMNGMTASPFHEFALANTFTDGQIKRSAASSLIHDSRTSRELLAGERVYLLKTEVKDSGIVFSLQSCIACDGSEVDLVQMAYRASLTFQFSKGRLATIDFAQIQRAIGQVFVFADLGTANGLQGVVPPPPQAAQSAPQSRTAVRDAPASIALGQTTGQVTASLGQPAKVVDLGNKKIYIYPDLKITFLDGKVSEIQ